MRWWLAMVAAVWGLTGSPVAAQPVTVQQPVVGNFGVNTTVSVPDRGSINLGSVNSAAMSRSNYGPLRTNTAIGLQTQGSSVSAHVYIHDLQAMDEALLATAPQASPDNVWDRKLTERRGANLSGLAAAAPAPASRAADFEARALKAEQSGKPAVALTYWRLAAKAGSTLARAKLAEPPASAAVAAKSVR